MRWKFALPANRLASIPPTSAPAAASSPAANESQPQEDEAHIETINSPMVGTFYARPNPKAGAFVKTRLRREVQRASLRTGIVVEGIEAGQHGADFAATGIRRGVEQSVGGDDP